MLYSDFIKLEFILGENITKETFLELGGPMNFKSVKLAYPFYTLI